MISKGNWRNSCSCALFSTMNLVLNLRFYGEKMPKLWQRCFSSDIHFTLNQTRIRFVCFIKWVIQPVWFSQMEKEFIIIYRFSWYTLKHLIGHSNTRNTIWIMYVMLYLKLWLLSLQFLWSNAQMYMPNF